jgi:hypothetical protein
MAKLEAAERNRLPAKEFGLPGQRKYPLPDKSHQVFAKAMATKEQRKGKLSPASAAKIREKANRLLGEK